jgi:hypothetical protein
VATGHLEWQQVTRRLLIGPIGRSSGCHRSFSHSPGRLISLSPMLLPGGGHVLPVLHRGHVELPPGDVLELSSGNAVSRHLCIAGDDFEPAGPSAQAQNSATLLYSVLEMSWEPSLAKVN